MNIIEYSTQFQEALIEEKAIQEEKFLSDVNDIINEYYKRAPLINNIKEAVEFMLNLSKRIYKDISEGKLPVYYGLIL